MFSLQKFDLKIAVLVCAIVLPACGGGGGTSEGVSEVSDSPEAGSSEDISSAPLDCVQPSESLDFTPAIDLNDDNIDTPLTSRTWWVVSGSSPGGDGSEDRPWNSVGDINVNKNEIFDDTSEERIVYIVGEFTNDPLIFDGVNAATADRPIKIRGDAPGRRPGILDGTGNDEKNSGVWLAHDDYIRISGLEVRNWSSGRITDCIKIELCNGIGIDNIYVHHCGFNGIVGRDVEDFIIQDSIIHSNAKGIVVGSRDLGESAINNNILLKGNVSFNNRIYGMQLGGDENAVPIRFDINARAIDNVLYGNGSGLQIENAGAVEVAGNHIYNNNYKNMPEIGNEYNSGIVIQSVHDFHIHENNIFQHDSSSILWTKHQKDNYNIEIYRNSFDDATEAHFSSVPYGTSGDEGNFFIFSNRLMHSAGVGNDFNVWKTDIASTVANNTGSGGVNGVNAQSDGVTALWSFTNNIWSSYSKIVESVSAGALNMLTNCYYMAEEGTLVTHNGLDYDETDIFSVDPGAVIGDPLLDEWLNVSSLGSPCLLAGTEVSGVTVDIDGNEYLNPPSIGMTAYESVSANLEEQDNQCN